MLWLGVAVAAFLFSTVASTRKATQFVLYARVAFGLALIVMILSEAGAKAFSGSETSLLGAFVIGLAILVVGYFRQNWGRAPAAIMFTIGFDVLRPDAYSYLPAALLGILVLAVAIRAFLQLSDGIKKNSPRAARLLLGLKIFAMGLMLYSALFKMIDRGWALPWAYMASAGALLFATSQLWYAWEKMLKRKTVPVWLQIAASDLGTLLIVAAAFFVYREFI